MQFNIKNTINEKRNEIKYVIYWLNLFFRSLKILHWSKLKRKPTANV